MESAYADASMQRAREAIAILLAHTIVNSLANVKATIRLSV
jgi:hypothetical protein